jgi:IS30 family transposase
MSSGAPWSQDEDQRLRDLALSGLPVQEIALRMNRSSSVIRRHAERLKINIAGSRTAPKPSAGL